MRVHRSILFPLSLTALLLSGVHAVADGPATTPPEHQVEVQAPQSGLQPDLCSLQSDAVTDLSPSWLPAAQCSRHCATRSNCPPFFPIGCSGWDCKHHCCVLIC